jgi:4-deoxy-L-threo-5-hexosulose-uronate ketol-isomerase
MDIRYTPDPTRFEFMNTPELRESFLVENLFRPGEIVLLYTDVDRAIVGGIVPTASPLKLEAGPELRAEFFAQRREIGIIAIGGGSGSVSVNGESFPMTKLDALYIGRGARDIVFASDSPDSPARFYLISYPAHTSLPTRHIRNADAQPTVTGTDKDSNRRTIYKYIHPGGIPSCQLVMGCTILAPGSVWNTMTPHTHARRTEVYLYFDLPADAAVFHFMGEPSETRHVVVRNGEAVLSPSWSIHAGAGTTNYAFVWAMGGENQDFGDMDGVALKDMG